jgi:hypothetical protein
MPYTHHHLDSTFRSFMQLTAVVAVLLLGYGLLCKWGVLPPPPEHTPSKRPHHPTLLHYEHLDFYEGMLVPMEEEGEEEL